MNEKEKLFCTFIITLILMGVSVGATVVGPDGTYDADYTNATIGNFQNIFLSGSNYTANLIAGGSGWDGTGALYQNGTRELTANWDAGNFNITADTIHAKLNASDYVYYDGDNRTDILANPFSAFSFVFSSDGSKYSAKNMSSGQIEYTGTVLETVIQNVADDLSQGGDRGGSLYFEKSLNPTDYAIPGRFTLAYDFELTGQVRLYEGISLYSYGALFYLNLDETAFWYNGYAEHYYQKHSSITIRGLNFVGINANTNCTVAWFNNTGRNPTVELITTEEVYNILVFEGESYRPTVENCVLLGAGAGRRGGIAIRFFEGTGGDGPNAAAINDCDISVFVVAVQCKDVAGGRFYHNYHEGNTITYNISTSTATVDSPYILIVSGQVGVKSWSSGTRVVNPDFSIDDNGIGVWNAAEYAVLYVAGGYWYLDGANATGVYSTANHYGSIAVGTVHLVSGATFANVDMDRGSITGGFIQGGNPAIEQNGNDGIMDGIIFYNSIVALDMDGYNYKITDIRFSSCTTDMNLGGNNHRIFDNWISGLVTISAGAHDFKNNQGYETEWTVSGEYASDDWIPHGLCETPEHVLWGIWETDSRYFLQTQDANTTHVQLYMWDDVAGSEEAVAKTVTMDVKCDGN